MQIGETTVPFPSGEEIRLVLSELDISLYNGEEKVTQLSGPATVTLRVILPDGYSIQDFAVVHFNGTDWETIPHAVTGYDAVSGEYTIEFHTDSFSPFALVLVKEEPVPTPTPTPTPKPKPKSSSYEGTSVWGTVDPTAEPTVTPTVTQAPTAAPTETPTKPADSPVPIAGVLAGLGAAAVVFGLRMRR